MRTGQPSTGIRLHHEFQTDTLGPLIFCASEYNGLIGASVLRGITILYLLATHPSVPARVNTRS